MSGFFDQRSVSWMRGATPVDPVEGSTLCNITFLISKAIVLRLIPYE